MAERLGGGRRRRQPPGLLYMCVEARRAVHRDPRYVMVWMGGRLGWTVGVDGERSDPFTPLEHPVPAAGRGIRARWTGSEATRIAERGAGGVNEHRGEHRGAGQLIPGAQRGAGQLRPGGRSNEERSSDPTKRPDVVRPTYIPSPATSVAALSICALHLRSPSALSVCAPTPQHPNTHPTLCPSLLHRALHSLYTIAPPRRSTQVTLVPSTCGTRSPGQGRPPLPTCRENWRAAAGTWPRWSIPAGGCFVNSTSTAN